MKKYLSVLSTLLILSAGFFQPLSAKDTDTTATTAADSLQLQVLTYDTTGSVNIGLNLARLDIPKGFKFLNAKQSQYVLHDLWGNPPSQSTLGMIFPTEAGELVPTTWAIEISYDEDGHVKDDDAKDIKYDDLLKDMQKQVEEASAERKKAGYHSYELTGWASPPYYDEKEKKLHWAKRILFEGDSAETLNYNIRILGRKGVLVLNAIGSMDQLAEIKSQINPVLASINFTKGNQYAEFDESLDKTAAYGIGGLIAGGILLKTGLLAKIGLVLLKFSKVIIVGATAVGGAVWKFFTGKKDEQA